MSEQNQSKLKLREFGLTTLSIQNKTTVFVLIAIITLSGISSYLSVPKEAFPEIVVPEIFVSTAYPGNSPANMEKLVTRPLEKEITPSQASTKSRRPACRDSAPSTSSSTST